ncbi:hypothetical protein [Burkholderia pseudomallei]|uniref:BP39L family lectin n=1 Tax=Burkholderia pseudomallei TaxID=28450 RepID=UPI0018C7A8DD|nr:hypothetical protein [Burkholderia pseudomallei]MBG1252128.1 hypothetical protein [Burkholderia pseudomallei]
MAKLAASNQFGIPNQTDVFAVDGNGSLRVSWVVSAGAWNGPAQIGPAALFPSRAAVASSNQFGIPNQTDVFAVGRDGALNVAWVVSADRWNGPTPISAAGLFPAGAAIAASNQFGIPNQTDVFAVSDSGALNVAWVVSAERWNGPIPISAAGHFPASAPLATSNQFGIPNQTDVFVVDNKGALNVAWVVGAGSWNGPIPISPPGLFPPGAAVAASNQFGIPNQTDVFVVDNQGALNVAWVVGADRWNGPVPISPAGLFPPGAAVAASNQFGIPNQTDVFAVGRDGALRVAWVVSAGNWNGPVSISPTNLFPAGAAVAASNQFGIPNQTDVFAADSDGVLHVAWVVSAGNWNGPISIA